jgi:UDP:flavonoid glycosyltransferase YjiC (YdhE family)
MRVLLSTIGSRGDVQPLVALGLQLRALGQEVRPCVPPDFRDWIESLGFPVTPVGPDVRTSAASSPPATPAPSSPERLRQVVEATVATQFETIAAAAQGCDVIVATTSPADRRWLSGREDGHSLHLRRLLPDSAPIATPRANPVAHAGTDAGTRNG